MVAVMICRVVPRVDVLLRRDSGSGCISSDPILFGHRIGVLLLVQSRCNGNGQGQGSYQS